MEENMDRNTRRPRVALLIGLPLLVIIAAAMSAHAFDTSWIAANQPLSAQKLKADLDETATRLGGLESGARLQKQVDELLRANTRAATENGELRARLARLESAVDKIVAARDSRVQLTRR
jgi:hypothetical protein